MDIIRIIKEEIQNYEWGKEQVADKPVTPNRMVYHVTQPAYRENIYRNGLEPRVGDSYASWSGGKNAIPAVFATNDRIENITGGVRDFAGDIWGIDTTRARNKWFADKHFAWFKDAGINNPHIVTFEKVPADALVLVHKANEYQ